MTNSGTYVFNPSTDDVLTEAWERLGKNPEALTGDVARAARRSLDYLQAEWSNDGLNLWQCDQQTLSLVAGTAVYTLAAATVEPLDVQLTVSGVERTLAPIGRSDYASIPTKTDQGAPTQYWAQRGASAVTLRLYPTPDQAYTLSYWRLRLPMDAGTLGQNIDIPPQWRDALASGLAARLATKFGPERKADLTADYLAAYGKARGENRQRGPLTIMPRFR